MFANTISETVDECLISLIRNACNGCLKEGFQKAYLKISLSILYTSSIITIQKTPKSMEENDTFMTSICIHIVHVDWFEKPVALQQTSLIIVYYHY